MKMVIDLPLKARCVAFSPDGNQIAVGTEGGKVTVFNIQGKTSSITADVQVCKKPVGTLAFSGDGKLLAAGCADSKIYLLVIAH